MDGSYGEGGGQIFRMALAFSALRGEEVRITNIRAGRPKPGLASQHITAANAVVSMSHGRTEGLSLGSSEVTFRPGHLEGGSFRLDVGTAGSVTLILQACLLPAIFAEAPTRLTLRGGTDVKWSPPSDYFMHVFLGHLERMGVQVDMRVLKRGYYPRGGGLVDVRVRPVPSVRPLSLTSPGRKVGIGGRAHISNLPPQIAQRMRKAALGLLVGYGDAQIERAAYGEAEAAGPGGAIVLWAKLENTILGSAALAERGVPAEELGRRAAEKLLADLKAGATLDIHAADQLLPYMAVAEDESSFLVREVSGHTRTLFWLLSKFVEVDFREGEANGIRMIGVNPIRT